MQTTTTPSGTSSDFINPIRLVPLQMVQAIFVGIHHPDEDDDVTTAKEAAVKILTAISAKFGTAVISQIGDIAEEISEIGGAEEMLPAGPLLADLATTVGIIRADRPGEGWRHQLLVNYGELLRDDGEFTLATTVKVLDTVRAVTFASASDVRERLQNCGCRARLFAGVEWPAPVDRRSALSTGGEFTARDADGHDIRDSR